MSILGILRLRACQYRHSRDFAALRSGRQLLVLETAETISDGFEMVSQP
jgi:hypothetical protein